MNLLLVALLSTFSALGFTDPDRKSERKTMVKEQIEMRGISNKSVLDAMEKVPRHEFIPPESRASAYADTPLPIGYGQTISQPYIVAYMTEALQVSGGDKVLEVGTGSGYQAAVLGELAKQVYTIEIVKELAGRASETLRQLGYKNIQVRHGDGYDGWPEHAPFNAIIVTAAPEHIPEPLIKQLAINGRLVAPVGSLWQQIVVLTKTPKGVIERRTIDVRFVPMTGKARQHR